MSIHIKFLRVRIAQIVVEEYLKRLPDNFVVATEKGLRVRK